MSDFGANIFDDHPTPPRRQAPPPAETPTLAPDVAPGEAPGDAAREPAEPHEGRRERVQPPRRAERRAPPAPPVHSNPWHDQESTHDDDHDPRAQLHRRDEAREPRSARRDERGPHRHPAGPRPPRPDLPTRRDGHDGREREPRREPRPHRDAGLGTHDGRAERRQPRESQPRAGVQRPVEPRTTPTPAASEAATAAVDKVVLLIDLDALRTGANTRGVELAWNRLQRALARGRTIAGASALAIENRKLPAGFTPLAAGGDFAAGVEFAAAAFAGASHGATVLLAPVTPTLKVLARALASRNLRVELVDFEAGQADGLTVQPLGKDCLFVP